MTLDAFGRVIGIRPVTEPFKVDFKTYWLCHFPGAQYRTDGGPLCEIRGRGTLGRKARTDFVHRIHGHVLVLNAGTSRERQFPVPDSLTE